MDATWGTSPRNNNTSVRYLHGRTYATPIDKQGAAPAAAPMTPKLNLIDQMLAGITTKSCQKEHEGPYGNASLEDDDSENGDSEYAGNEGLQCYDCPEPVCPSSRKCTDCSSLNYVCPDTGQCIDLGAWAWLQCSLTGEEEDGNPEEEFAAKEVELEAKEDVFKLAFVGYRIDAGILDKKLAEEEWRLFAG